MEHGHAALEKLIKGIITERDKNPPRIHSLLKLVSITLIDNVDDDIKTTLKELDRLYISVRYPDDINYIQSLLPEAKVDEVLKKVKGIYTMLEKNLK
ncbi:MAG: HEPN domain-containing protein [Candidatus Melainabacteria bacterium]|nr:HEPN domain-containing protein [Candidatus Melainabacteria bacterium]